MTSSPVAFTANAHDLYAEIILDALDLEDMCVCVCDLTLPRAKWAS